MLSILLISEVFIAGILSCLLDNLIPGDWHALYSAPYLLLVRPVLRKVGSVITGILIYMYSSCLMPSLYTCEIKLFQNYFIRRRRPSEIIIFQHLKTCLKLFQNYFRGLLLFMNIFQHVHCR